MKTHLVTPSTLPISEHSRWQLGHERRKRRRQMVVPWVAVSISFGALLYTGWIVVEILAVKQ